MTTLFSHSSFLLSEIFWSFIHSHDKLWDQKIQTFLLFRLQCDVGFPRFRQSFKLFHHWGCGLVAFHWFLALNSFFWVLFRWIQELEIWIGFLIWGFTHCGSRECFIIVSIFCLWPICRFFHLFAQDICKSYHQSFNFYKKFKVLLIEGTCNQSCRVNSWRWCRFGFLWIVWWNSVKEERVEFLNAEFYQDKDSAEA